MNNFPQPPTHHMGGLAFFEFVEVEGVAAIPLPFLQKIYSITLKIGYAFAQGYSSQDELKYSEKAQQGDDGTYFEAKLEGFAPDSTELIQLFHVMDGRRFILRITDNDNIKRVVGTIDQPLTFSADFNTQTISGQKGHSYVFSGIIEKRAPIYVPSSASSSASSTSGSGTT